ncbi:hypothetical protein CRUP_022067 [Coryphaenoides rupestris]|nr:hypothetical protein CRUP_022067 [Coryphaenoides rupestris]
MAEPRFNNPYFWPPPPSMTGQEQLMTEKIRAQHLPPAAVPSQQPLLAQTEGAQHVMSIPKAQQMPGLHPHSPSPPDIALHARPASSSVSGRILGDVNLNLDDKAAIKARGLTGNLNASDVITPTTPTSSSQSRMGGASSPHLISGLAGCHGMEPIKTNGGLAGLLGPPPKMERGRKKIKAENGTSPLLVVPYPLLASGNDQCVSFTAKEGKTYRIHTGDRPYKCLHPGCDKAFTQLSNLQSHQRQHNKDKPFKCSNCFRAYSDAASLQSHLSVHAIKNAKAYCCSMCGRAYTSETYLMKHMSKHTVVEHMK